MKRIIRSLRRQVQNVKTTIIGLRYIEMTVIVKENMVTNTTNLIYESLKKNISSIKIKDR